MSVTQIIQELPKLTAADLFAVRRKLMELADENEDIALSDAMALEGTLLLDQMSSRVASKPWNRIKTGVILFRGRNFSQAVYDQSP